MILRGCNDCNDWSLDLRKIFGQGETEWISDYDRMTSILGCFSRDSHMESHSLANNVCFSGRTWVWVSQLNAGITIIAAAALLKSGCSSIGYIIRVQVLIKSNSVVSKCLRALCARCPL